MAGTWKFRHQVSNKQPYSLPSPTTLSWDSTSLGWLVRASSNHFRFVTGVAAAADAGHQEILGILTGVPESSMGEITRILPGDVVEAQYSTTVERSSGVSVINTTSKGRYFGLGDSTTEGRYVDPSLAGAVGTSDAFILRMLGFSTKSQTIWGTINSSNLYTQG